MNNRQFHRTHKPEEPHKLVELEAMKLKHKRDLEKQRAITLISLAVFLVGVYIHHQGDPLGIPLIWSGLGGVGLPAITPISNLSKSDDKE